MMRGIGRRLMGATFCMLAWASIQAQDITVYVVEPSGGYTPSPPYTNWAMAATSVIDAVNTATNNGWTNVVVSNGTYYLTNQVAILSPMTLRSWNNGALDPTNTILDGNNFDGKPVTNRVCAIQNLHALVEGFTIRNGYKGAGGDIYGGGGVYISVGVLRNCLVVSNYTTTHGGGTYISTSNGLALRCVLANNTAEQHGGGLACWLGRLQDSSVISNVSLNIGTTAYGSGVYLDGGEVTGCRVAYNTGAQNGGGVYLRAQGALNRCEIAHNSAIQYGGGCSSRDGRTISNCLVSCNSAGAAGGIYLRATLNRVVNCTVVSNYATSVGGLYVYNNTTIAPMINCIVYDNAGGTYSNHYNTGTWLTWTNCCTAPIDTLSGANNTSADPLWADWAGGDYRLRATSPCLNAGLMLDGLVGTLDLDGRPRVDRMTGRVDLGAYEYTYPGTLFHCR